MYKKFTAAIIAIIMITGMAATFASPVMATSEKAEVTLEPDVVPENDRVLLDFDITNLTSYDIMEILIRDTDSRFTEPIGGENVAENLENAADNLAGAIDFLSDVSSYFDDASESLYDFGANLILIGEELEEASKWIDEADAAYAQAADNLYRAARRMIRAGQELQKEEINFDSVRDRLNDASTHLLNIGTPPLAPFTDSTLVINVPLRVSELAGDLGITASAFDNGDFTTADNAFDNFATSLSNLADNLDDSGTWDADLDLQDALDHIKNAVDYAEDGSDDLSNVVDSLVDAGLALYDSANNEGAAFNIRDAGLFIENIAHIGAAGDNLHDAGWPLGWAVADNLSENIFLAGSNLAGTSTNWDNAGQVLGKILGGDYLVDLASSIWSAGDNLENRTAFSLKNASTAMSEVADYLDSAAAKMSETASKIGPEEWYIDTAASGPNEVLFRTDNDEYAIEQDGTKTFSFLWKSGDDDSTLRIWGYEDGGHAVDEHKFGPIKIEVEIAEEPSVVDAVVTQEGVGIDDLVGNTWQDGMATLTIEFDQEITDIDTIELRDNQSGDNLLPAISFSDLMSDDNITFTYEFEVGEWDENSPVQVWIDTITSVHNVDNEIQDNIMEFWVDTTSPALIGMRDLNWDNKTQPDTGNWFWVDNDADQDFYGQAEDNWTLWSVAEVLGYENFEVPDVLEIEVWADGVLLGDATQSAGDNFNASVTMPEGLTENLVLRITDWTGNYYEESWENVLIDLTPPEITFETVMGREWTDGVWINDNQPLISLTALDPGYPENGLGIAYENLKVMITSEDNKLDALNPDNFFALWNAGVDRITLDNMDPWDPETGVFENITDFEIPEGKGYVYVWASDNLYHNGDNGTVAGRSFRVDVTDPFTPASPDDTNITLGSLASPTLSRKQSLYLEGTASDTEADEVTVEILVDSNPSGWEVAYETTATEDNDWEWTATIELEEGLNKIGIRVTDPAGNSFTRTYGYIHSDFTGPVINITEPEETLSTSDSSIRVEAEVSDDVTDSEDLRVSLRSPQYMLQEGEITISPDGTLSVDVPLREGSNLITITARDEAGNVSTESVTVERTVTPWTMYMMIIAIIVVILAAIAVLKRS